MAIDIETGLDEFFKAQGSSEAQRQDAIDVLKGQCSMIGNIVALSATAESLDSEKSKLWIAQHKPHLLPPKFERSLADRAFADGSLAARGELLKQVGPQEMDKIAKSYGLKSAHDTKRGTAAAGSGEKKGSNAADHKNNPWHRSNFNVTEQGAILRALGPEKAAALARAVGSHIGATRPNPDY